MIKQRIQARSISAVAASKTVTIDLPCGPRYHQVILEHNHGGTATLAAGIANVLEIRVKVNGRVQRTHSGAELRDLNMLNGAIYNCAGAAGTAPGVSFPIFFAEPWRKDVVSQDALAWATNKWTSLQIEVDLGSAATPTMVCSAIVDNYQPEKEGGIMKVIRQNFGAGGTSFDVVTMDKRDFLQQISFYPDSTNHNAITKVTFRKDGIILHDLSASANAAVLNTNGMTPTASTRGGSYLPYDLVFDHDDLLGSAVPMEGTRDCTITIEAGATMAGTITALICRIGSTE